MLTMSQPRMVELVLVLLVLVVLQELIGTCSQDNYSTKAMVESPSLTETVYL